MWCLNVVSVPAYKLCTSDTAALWGCGLPADVVFGVAGDSFCLARCASCEVRRPNDHLQQQRGLLDRRGWPGRTEYVAQ